MPSASTASWLSDRFVTQRNATILVAILVGIPTSYAVASAVGGQATGFLLLVTLAVAVPTAYDEYWPRYDNTGKAVGWILGACTVATAAFTALYLVGTDLLSLSTFVAASGAFLVTDLGGFALLGRRHRPRA